jgi:hypothetical protein
VPSVKAIVPILALLLSGFSVSSIAAREIAVFPVRSELRLSTASDHKLARAFQLGLSEFPVKCDGVVTRKLSDDTFGIRHQRFILKLDNGQTLLIAHNIDLAPRVKFLRIGDRIRIHGEYIWNSQGGMIHWTHRDPDGDGLNGWIKYRGKLYH